MQIDCPLFYNLVHCLNSHNVYTPRCIDQNIHRRLNKWCPDQKSDGNGDAGNKHPFPKHNAAYLRLCCAECTHSSIVPDSLWHRHIVNTVNGHHSCQNNHEHDHPYDREHRWIHIICSHIFLIRSIVFF